MNDREAYELIMKHLCKEVCRIAEEMQKNQRMTSQNLEELDKMFHLKKGMLTCKAMEDEYEEEEDGFSGNSGRRGRSRTTGRYVSRDAGPGMDTQSYADGFSQGYNEAMNQMNNGGNSGHIPMMPYPRRW